MHNLTTTISDFTLFLVTALIALKLFTKKDFFSRLASLGFALSSFAALIGTFKFAFFPNLHSVHMFFSQMAGYLGIPLIAFSFWKSKSPLIKKPKALKALIFGLLFCGILFSTFLEIKLYRTIIAGASNLSIIAYSFLHMTSLKNKALGVVGPVLIIASALFIGIKGSLFGFLRIDLFHYTYALACFCLYTALKSTKAE